MNTSASMLRPSRECVHAAAKSRVHPCSGQVASASKLRPGRECVGDYVDDCVGDYVCDCVRDCVGDLASDCVGDHARDCERVIRISRSPKARGAGALQVSFPFHRITLLMKPYARVVVSDIGDCVGECFGERYFFEGLR